MAASPRPSVRSTSGRCAVNVEGLVLTYGPETVFDGLSLKLDAGTHCALVGPSGSGKTSLLACLAGRLQPQAGSVTITGRLARIHQDLRLVAGKSARANVMDGALGDLGFLHSLAMPAETREQANRLLDRVGLAHRKDALVGTLSGGEAQRVAIARALMRRPDILLADEPVASLDPANAEAMMSLLRELQREEGLTLLTVLHDPALAARHADQVMALRSGQLVSVSGLQRAELLPVRQPVPTTGTEPVRGTEGAVPRWIMLALFAILVLVSLPVLSLGNGRADGALASVFDFIVQLWPSLDELGRVDWPQLGASWVATLQMAVLGTAAAAVIALPLAALAARNVAPAFIGAPLRLLLNVWRSIPSIIWALLFVAAVGLGSVAGVIALTAYAIGYLTKFFYESFEAVASAAPEALREFGASGPQRFIHAVWPLSRASIAGHGLFMLEYNVRAASILGLVGAGGLGHDLKLAVEWGNWHSAGVILAVLAATTLVVDAISARIRARLT